MKNTDHISELIDVGFEGKLYQVRKVHIKGFGDRYIAPLSLGNALIPDGVFVTREAKELDEEIFYYVQDKYINFDDKKLAKYVEENVL